MKKKIRNISLNRLNNGDYYQLIENITTIASTEVSVAGIRQELHDDIITMQLSFKKEKLNAETQKIVDADVKRDRALMKLNYRLKSETLNDRKPDNIAAANTLLLVVKNYGAGEIVGYDFNKETAHLTNLVTDLATKTAEITLLDVQADIDFIKTTNQDFQALYKDRGDVMGDMKNVVPFYKLRKIVDEHYRDFMQAVESIPKITPASAPQIAALIDRFNVEIEKFKLLIPANTPSNVDVPPAV